MATYATLEQARRELVADSTDTSEDARLTEYLEYVTGRIDEIYERWRFEPVLETRLFDLSAVDRYSGKLTLDAPLLDATSIIDGDGATLVLWDGDPDTRAAANVAPYPINVTPIDALVKLHGDSWQNATGDAGYGSIQITGLWGFRRKYASLGWRDSLDTLAAGSSSGAVSLTLHDVDAADITGRTPRFSPGQLIMIDDEFMHVRGVNTTTNVIAVEPEANGTSPAAHLIDAPVYTWYPDQTIIRATLRWAAYLHSRKGNFEQITLDGFGGATKFPSDMPDEVAAILRQLPSYLTIGAV